jgi:hypothetical protein
MLLLVATSVAIPTDTFGGDLVWDIPEVSKYCQQVVMGMKSGVEAS